MNKSEKIDLLAAAITKMQAQVKGASKNKTNPHFKSDYANLESVMDATKEQLAEAGLGILQQLDMKDGFKGATTLVTHASGQWIETFIELPSQNIHTLMGAFTYYRRGNWAGATGCPQVDDDGNTAANKDADVGKVADKKASPGFKVEDYKHIEAKTVEYRKPAHDPITTNGSDPGEFVVQITNEKYIKGKKIKDIPMHSLTYWIGKVEPKEVKTKWDNDFLSNARAHMEKWNNNPAKAPVTDFSEEIPF